MGSPESEDAGIIPDIWIQALVGDSPATIVALMRGDAAVIPGWMATVWPVWTNFFASITGALMYFATLTEVRVGLDLSATGGSAKDERAA